MKKIYIAIGADNYILKFSLRIFEGCTVLSDYPEEALIEPWHCKMVAGQLVFEPKL